MSSQAKPNKVETTHDPYADVRLNTEKLDWSQAGLTASLTVIYEYAVRKATGNIQWYKRSSNVNGRRAQTIRVVAAISAGLGGLIPILTGLDVGVNTGLTIDPALATVFLAFGAGILVFDQYFGISSSWMRSITTGMDLGKELDEFQIKWEAQRLAAGGQPLTFEGAQAFIQIAQEFMAKIENIVRAETNEWIVEFKNSMALLSNRLGQNSLGDSDDNNARSNTPPS